LVLAAVAALSPLVVHATDAGPEPVLSVVVDSGSSDPAVIVTPIPMPAAVTQLLQPANPAAKALSAGKAKAAQKKPLPTIMLSRAERQQIALAKSSPKPGVLLGDLSLRKQFRDEDSQGGYDDIPLHGSYSRPRLVEDDTYDADNADEADALPGHIRLRLYMARMKALEAHALARAAGQANEADTPLPPAVSQRLAEARMKALAAHRNRFG
jgi:hypothetical protein